MKIVEKKHKPFFITGMIENENIASVKAFEKCGAKILNFKPAYLKDEVKI